MPACRNWPKPETRCADARGDSDRCARLRRIACLAGSAAAQDSTGWHRLEIPGGRATLRSLGVADNRERSAVMVELIRRFLFATTSQAALESSLRKLPAGNGDSLTVPLPLAPAKWSAVVFERTIPPSRLFAEILLDPSARLLFHGLAGLDRDTRTWIEGEDDLLRRLYRNPDALKSFALFAPAAAGLRRTRRATRRIAGGAALVRDPERQARSAGSIWQPAVRGSRRPHRRAVRGDRLCGRRAP